MEKKRLWLDKLYADGFLTTREYLAECYRLNAQETTKEIAVDISTLVLVILAVGLLWIILI